MNDVSKTEAKYHFYDLETVAIMEAVKHFPIYLFGFYQFSLTTGKLDLKKNLNPNNVKLLKSSMLLLQSNTT